MLMWTDWTNWDENLTSNEVKHLSRKKADKGWRRKVETLELSSRIFTCPNPSFWTLLSTQKKILEKNGERLATLRSAWARKAVCPQNCPHFLFQNTKHDKRSFLALTMPLLLGSSGHLAPRADPWNSLSWRQQTGTLFFLICYSGHKGFTICPRPVNCLSGFKEMLAQLWRPPQSKASAK